MYLVLGSISNQSLGVGESHIARSGAVSLIISNDFYLSVLKHSHAGVRRAKINADCWSLCHFLQYIHNHHYNTIQYNTIQYNIRLLKLDRMQAQQYG